MLHVADGVAEFRFGPRRIGGLDEATLLNLFVQFKDWCGSFSGSADVRLTCDGELLSSYRHPSRWISTTPRRHWTPKRSRGESAVDATQGLDGLNITIGPSHGRFWNGSGWYCKERPLRFGWRRFSKTPTQLV